MYRILNDTKKRMKGDLLDFSQKLIRTPSISLQEKSAADLVEEKMKELGFDHVVRDDFGNVVGVIYGSLGNGTVLLNSHMDTVAPGEKEWRFDPFCGEIEAGNLLGLGASDCKAGLAAQVFAAAALKQSLLPLRGNVVVAATVAEENGLGLGIQETIEKTLADMELNADFAILGEPTTLGLYYGHDGWMEMDVRLEGSNPFHVDDTTKALYSDLSENSRKDIANGRESFSVAAPVFDDRTGFRRATMRVARRLHDTEDVGTVLGQLKHEAHMVAQQSGDVAVQVQVCQEQQQLYSGKTTVVKRIAHAWSTDPFHPMLTRARQSLAAAGCACTPGKWNLGRLGMGTAGCQLVKRFNIPTIGYGPGTEDMAHSANESVSVDRIVECAYGTAAIVHGLVGVPVYGWTSDEI